MLLLLLLLLANSNAEKEQLPLVTLVDSLDTLAIMGNASEFRRAVRYGSVSQG